MTDSTAGGEDLLARLRRLAPAQAAALRILALADAGNLHPEPGQWASEARSAQLGPFNDPVRGIVARPAALHLAMLGWVGRRPAGRVALTDTGRTAAAALTPEHGWQHIAATRQDIADDAKRVRPPIQEPLGGVFDPREGRAE